MERDHLFFSLDNSNNQILVIAYRKGNFYTFFYLIHFFHEMLTDGTRKQRNVPQ